MGQRSTTHVANAYDEDILKKIDADRQYVTLQSINVSAAGSMKGVTSRLRVLSDQPQNMTGSMQIKMDTQG